MVKEVIMRCPSCKVDYSLHETVRQMNIADGTFKDIQRLRKTCMICKGGLQRKVIKK